MRSNGLVNEIKGDEAKFELGQRVAVLAGCGWPSCPTGTIRVPWNEIYKFVPDWGPLYRTMSVKGKVKLSYWVEFDTPQFDGDGDGPSPAGEILEQYLVKISF